MLFEIIIALSQLRNIHMNQTLLSHAIFFLPILLYIWPLNEQI